MRQSQSRGLAAIAKSPCNNAAVKSSSASRNDDSLVVEAPPDFVRLGIQRMLQQAQEHNSNSYNGNHSTEIQNSKALQGLELVQVRAAIDTYCMIWYYMQLHACVLYIQKKISVIVVTHWSNIFLALSLYYSLTFLLL
jgi:hypothetical protein